jgi:hypothetical protein
MVVRKGLEEQLVQKFSYRCPYCNEPISYDQFNLKVGENEIQCPSCKKIYIKAVAPSFTPLEIIPAILQRGYILNDSGGFNVPLEFLTGFTLGGHRSRRH